MRLIDADALEQILQGDLDENLTDTDYGLGIRIATKCDLEYVQDAPTIEAIPIEWLEDIIEDWKDEARKIDEARRKR